MKRKECEQNSLIIGSSIHKRKFLECVPSEEVKYTKQKHHGNQRPYYLPAPILLPSFCIPYPGLIPQCFEIDYIACKLIIFKSHLPPERIIVQLVFFYRGMEIRIHLPSSLSGLTGKNSYRLFGMASGQYTLDCFVSI